MAEVVVGIDGAGVCARAEIDPKSTSDHVKRWQVKDTIATSLCFVLV